MARPRIRSREVTPAVSVAGEGELNTFFSRFYFWGSGEMTQQLRVLDALPEEQSLISSTKCDSS